MSQKAAAIRQATQTHYRVSVVELIGDGIEDVDLFAPDRPTAMEQAVATVVKRCQGRSGPEDWQADPPEVIGQCSVCGVQVIHPSWDCACHAEGKHPRTCGNCKVITNG